MSDPRITDQAVEKAARAIYAFPTGCRLEPWAAVTGTLRREYLRAGRAALEAALPHLAPQPLTSREPEGDRAPAAGQARRCGMNDSRITDEMVKQAAAAYQRAYPGGIVGARLVQVRAALEAALPHLTPESDDGAALPIRRDGRGHPAAAPSSSQPVDRVALERVIDCADHYDTCAAMLSPAAGYECSCLLADLRALLNGGESNG